MLDLWNTSTVICEEWQSRSYVVKSNAGVGADVGLVVFRSR